MRKCSATTKEGKQCGMMPMKGEQFCVTHSPTEKGKQGRLLQAKHHTKYDKSGNLTLTGMLVDLRGAKRRLLKDPKTSQIQKARTLMLLDTGIMRLQKLIEGQKLKKPEKKKRIPTGTALIVLENGKIVRKSVNSL